MQAEQHYGQIVDLYKARDNYFAEIADLEKDIGYMANLGPEPNVDVDYLVTFRLEDETVRDLATTSEFSLPDGIKPVYEQEGILEFPRQFTEGAKEQETSEAWKHLINLVDEDYMRQFPVRCEYDTVITATGRKVTSPDAVYFLKTISKIEDHVPVFSVMDATIIPLVVRAITGLSAQSPERETKSWQYQPLLESYIHSIRNKLFHKTDDVSFANEAITFLSHGITLENKDGHSDSLKKAVHDLTEIGVLKNFDEVQNG